MRDAEYSDLASAIAGLIEYARQNDSTATREYAVALFYNDGDRVRILLMHVGEGDRDAEVTWGVNRMAVILGARTAAWIATGPDEALVSVERRGAPTLEIHDLRRGTTRAVLAPFEIVAGGTPGEGWGWRETEGLFPDFLEPTPKERAEAERARREEAAAEHVPRSKAYKWTVN
jgi:hypothetical protein